MEVVIIGKQERKGNAKATGKPYHFVNIYYNKPQPGVVGLVGAEKAVDSAVIGVEDIYVGEMYDIRFDDRGRVEYMQRVTKSK